MAAEGEKKTVRVLCPKKKLFSSSNSSKFALGELKWLIGSPLFLPQFTVISSLRCLHFLNDQNPNFQKESDEIRTLLLRGLNIVGALIIISGGDYEEEGRKAVEFTCELRKCLFGEESCELIGGVADLSDGEVRFFRRNAKLQKMEGFGSVVYEEGKEDWLWEGGCLLRCEMGIKVPVYVRSNGTSDFEESSLTDVAAKLRDPHVAYLVEGRDWNGGGPSDSIVFHGVELDFKTFFDDQKAFHTNTKSNEKAVSCSFFCSKHKCILPSARDNADVIQVTVFSNQSRSSSISGAPIAQYVPASDPARLSMVNLKLDVLCYASKEFPVTSAICKLIIPGLVDQIIGMKRTIQSKLLEHNSQLCPYHFLPSGFLHPITTLYDLRYGETEVSQGEIRKALHERLGLPLDRPLLRTANALNFGMKAIADANLKSSSLLKDVHTEIPSSGVSGGVISLIDGSYEYYHYLLNGIDDSGWGCAYRSLQTIISWFKLQHYTSVRVPSHREIQQALVEIGDKEPAFVGSHDWIGAIELSFVLDKLLGVSCKIMNVRSGEELPEKCRELAMHFETQGTPIMIGGGVLAYTLLGVDYNEASGDCAFLILDPHYTGNDDLKKIVSGGWCGWKKAVDSKGRNFFLKDKFYNLLLPQRPNMV